jgi:hypothetical protein
MRSKESPSEVKKIQESEREVDHNKIKSSLDVITKEQVSNPESSFATDSMGEDFTTEVTIYNKNLALVKERKELELEIGINRVEYTNVAALIDSTSVMFEDTKNKETTVLEQNYEYDLVSGKKLLEKFLDKEITITDKEGDTYTGTLEQ